MRLVCTPATLSVRGMDLVRLSVKAEVAVRSFLSAGKERYKQADRVDRRVKDVSPCKGGWMMMMIEHPSGSIKVAIGWLRRVVSLVACGLQI